MENFRHFQMLQAKMLVPELELQLLFILSFSSFLNGLFHLDVMFTASD